MQYKWYLEQRKNQLLKAVNTAIDGAVMASNNVD
jgi:hypothetical protein